MFGIEADRDLSCEMSILFATMLVIWLLHIFPPCHYTSSVREQDILHLSLEQVTVQVQEFCQGTKQEIFNSFTCT